MFEAHERDAQKSALAERKDGELAGSGAGNPQHVVRNDGVGGFESLLRFSRSRAFERDIRTWWRNCCNSPACR